MDEEKIELASVIVDEMLLMVSLRAPWPGPKADWLSVEKKLGRNVSSCSSAAALLPISSSSSSPSSSSSSLSSPSSPPSEGDETEVIWLKLWRRAAAVEAEEDEETEDLRTLTLDEALLFFAMSDALDGG